MISRKNDRNYNSIRKISLENNYSSYAEGSCMVKFGDTHILCTASVDEKVPFWLRGSGKGWVTAEYGMLPRSTHIRMEREISKGKISGRTQEIQRLIGRSLRSIIDLESLGEIQIKIDCDVIQADGGTRTASITGAWVALHDAIKFLMSKGKVSRNPITEQVAAISCGIVSGESLIDLDYNEDSTADVDANFVLTDSKKIVEVQTTSEKQTLTKTEFMTLYELAESQIDILFKNQLNVISK